MSWNSKTDKPGTGKIGLSKIEKVAIPVIVLLTIWGVYSVMQPGSLGQQRENTKDSSTIAANFGILSRAHTDVCAYIGDRRANANYINSLPENYYLQGSCCTPMVYSHYVSQIEGLKNFSDITIIPGDPYNVSASLAKQLIASDGTPLTPAQQALFDSAMKLSSEGPCCCQCWAWYAHEGLGKALISQHGWSAQQIANLWSLEDCCGG